MSVIYIRDLVVEATHGVHQIEKQQAQQFRINVELLVDVSAAAISDRLEDTVDYSALRQGIINITKDSSFNLIERLAQAIADDLLAKDERIQKVTVSVEKLDVYRSGIPVVRLEVNRRS